MTDIRPHPGPQTQFLSTPADIAIYGGQAGGGKTYALLMEPLRHIHTDGFGAVIFRRTSPQITREGGMWDESSAIYPKLGARPRESFHDWTWKNGARITFASMEHETNRFDWDGSQIPLLGFDQLEHFTELQFWYMLGRNRSTCGVKPYVRATANPDPDSFLSTFIGWWIGEDGYPIKSRSGKVRWFIRLGEEILWSNHHRTLKKKYKGCHPLSVTFIPASLDDNPTLMEKDPLYEAKLDALPYIERMRLKEGNWKVRPQAGMYFKRDDFEILDRMPHKSEVSKIVRSWDLAAATPKKKNPDPDYTVGLKLVRLKDGKWVIPHIHRMRAGPAVVEWQMKQTAKNDGVSTTIRISQDPGQAGLSQVRHLTQMLAGYVVHSERETGEKTTRAGPVSAQSQVGNIFLVRGPWNEPFLTEVENFPEGRFDDQVDALSNAFSELADEGEPDIFFI